MEQINQYNPPPNPAKTTDARYAGYVDLYGDESWELDALEPNVIVALVRDAIELHMDAAIMEDTKAEVEAEREQLTEAASRWSEVADFLDGDAA